MNRNSDRKSRPFDATGDRPMPHPAGGAAAPDACPVPLLIGVKIENGFVLPYFEASSDEIRKLKIVTDGSLDIRVPAGKGLCRFNVSLDTGVHWTFRDDGDAMTLGADTPDDMMQYYLCAS